MVEEKDKQKQNGKAISRKHLFALWGTLITVLGTSIVPKIIDYLSDRPSVTDVQDMIAVQTEALTKVTKQNIETLKELRDVSVELQKQQARIEGCVETLEKIIRDCCTRRGRPGGRIPALTPMRSPPEAGESADEPDKAKPHPVMKIKVHEPGEKLPDFKAPWVQQEQRPNF